MPLEKLADHICVGFASHAEAGLVIALKGLAGGTCGMQRLDVTSEPETACVGGDKETLATETFRQRSRASLAGAIRPLPALAARRASAAATIVPMPNTMSDVMPT